MEKVSLELRNRLFPGAVALIYIAVAGIWIFLSDLALTKLVQADPGLDPALTGQTWKGWFFVFVTGVVLYFLLSAYARSLHRAQNSLALTQYALDHAAEAVLWFNESGRVIYSNRAASALFGYSPSELSKMSAVDLEPDLSNELHERRWSTLMQHRTLEHEGRFRCADGSWRHVEIRSTMIEREGEPLDFSFVLDVTRRKKAENDRRASEQRFHKATQEAPYPLMIFAEDGEILVISQSWLEITGYARSEITNLAAWTLLAYGDNRGAVEKAIQEVFHLVRGKDEGEFEVRCKDGTVRIWQFRSMSLGMLPDGRRLGMSMAVDLTERKRSEEQLKKQTEFLRAVIDCSPIPIFSLDPDGKVQLWSSAAEQVLGWSREEVSGSLLPIVPTDKLSEFNSIRKRILAGELIFGEELMRQKRDGSSFMARLSAGPIWDGQRNAVGIIASLEDITEQLRMQEEVRNLNLGLEARVAERTQQLEAANRELEAFSYSVSHDLRSPLRAMSGYSQMLLEDHGAELSEEVKRLCEVIRESAAEMGRLIDDLLSLSRAGRSELKISRVNMRDMAGAVFAEIAPPHPARRPQFFAEPMPFAAGDPNLLRQVWRNLLSNAIKFSSQRSDPIIVVGITRSARGNAYFVRDNGVGFDMQYADKLFGVFQRLHSRKDFDGTGVGLAIVQRIVHRHGGAIWAESSPGQGATIFFTLGEGLEAVPKPPAIG